MLAEDGNDQLSEISYGDYSWWSVRTGGHKSRSVTPTSSTSRLSGSHVRDTIVHQLCSPPTSPSPHTLSSPDGEQATITFAQDRGQPDAPIDAGSDGSSGGGVVVGRSVSPEKALYFSASFSDRRSET